MRNIPVIHDFARQRKISVRRVMDFVTIANPLGPSSRAKNAIRKSLKILDRPADDRSRFLVGAIARLNNVPEDNILLASSFETLLTSIIRFFQAGKVLCPAPYPWYYRKAVEGPVHFHFLELDEKENFVINNPFRQKDFSEYGAAIIPYPSFMSEKPFDLDDVHRMIAFAEDRGMPLIIDETLIQYTSARSAAGLLAGHPHCLVISSMTEYYALSGLPVSYCIGDAGTLAAIEQDHPLSRPSIPAAAAAAASIRDKAYHRRTRAYFTVEHDFIRERLQKIPGISFYTTACGSFVIKFPVAPKKGLETFSQHNILVDEISGSLFFPVKDHKWNARYLKTLKNIMGSDTDETP